MTFLDRLIEKVTNMPKWVMLTFCAARKLVKTLTCCTSSWSRTRS